MSSPNFRNFQHLKFLNWNANGVKLKRLMLEDFLFRYDIDLGIITETHLTAQNTFKISGYSIYRQDRISRTASGGVAICIKNTIKHYSTLPYTLTNLEAVAVNIEIQRGRMLCIIAAYQRPNTRLLEIDFHQIFTGRPTLLFGDLNSKHVYWDCRNTNPNGQRLLDAMSNLGLNISAPDEPTFYPTQQTYQPDILDITLQHNIYIPLFHQVVPELDSDHSPVISTMRAEYVLAERPTRLITGKVNWNNFRQKMNELPIPLYYRHTDDIDDAIDLLTYTIRQSISDATYTQYKQHKQSNVAPAHILNMIQEKNRLRKQWQRTRDPNEKWRLNRLCRKIKWGLSEHRLQQYHKYLEGLTPGDCRLWKETKRILGQYTPLPALGGETLAVTDEEKCELLAAHLETKFSLGDFCDTQNDELVNEELMRPYYSQLNSPVAYVTPTEIKQFVKALPGRKSPGDDNIPNVVLKTLPIKSIVYLTGIFNACFYLKYFPKAWTNAIVVVFHKQGKPRNELDSYRPISLLNTMSKLFEKTIHMRLVKHLEETQTIPAHQFGFKSHHSATHQLQRVVELITRGYEQKKYTSAIFLDVKAAFDTVWHEGLLYKLRNTGVPAYLYEVIRSFLERRTFQVRINSTFSSCRVIRAGVPQGAVLSPTLFSLYCCDIPQPQNAFLATFADDTMFGAQDFLLRSAIDRLQNVVDEAAKWFAKWKLGLNPRKTEAKIFALRRFNLQSLNTIHLLGNSIPWNPADQGVRYLGLLLDTRLTWRLHINTKLHQAYCRLHLLYPLLNRRKPLHIQCTLLLYKTLLRPLLTYACPVWLGASRTLTRKLQTYQNKVLRIAINAPWFIRNHKIHEELNMPTIHDYLNSLANNFLERMSLTHGATIFQLGRPTPHRRLKARLPQDILLSSS